MGRDCFPGGSEVKASASKEGDLGSISGRDGVEYADSTY